MQIPGGVNVNIFQSQTAGGSLILGTSSANNFIGATNTSGGFSTINLRGSGNITINSYISGTVTTFQKPNSEGGNDYITCPTNSFVTTNTTPGILIGNGTLNIPNIASNGVNCALGAGQVGGPIQRIDIGGGTSLGSLIFTNGSGGISDRIINLPGTGGTAALNASSISPGYVKFTSPFQSTGAGPKTLALTGTNTGPNEIAGGIVNNSTANTTAVTKTGVGTWILSGTNNYTGATTISGGILSINGGTLSNTAITVTSPGILAVKPGNATTINAGVTTVVGAGATLNLGAGTLDMTDGAVSTLNLQQESTFAGAALTIASGATLMFDLGSSGADLLAVSKAASVAGTINITLNTNGVASFTPGTYNLITASAGLNGATWQFTGGGTSMVFTRGGSSYNVVLNTSATAISVTVSSYTVTYNGNGNTAGTVPTDANNYANGATVTVQANPGSLTKSGQNVVGWNTQADGGGFGYAASGSATFTMGSANVTLYAIYGVPNSPPTVTASPASSIGTTTATLNGGITYDGASTILDRGFVYNTSPGVTMANNKTTVAGTTGNFFLPISSLGVNVQYYFRAYGSNTFGNTLSAELSFWTLANAPTAPTVSGATATSLNVAIGSGSGNPANTTYAIQESITSQYVQANGTLGASPVYQTAATWGTKTVTGLLSGTPYTFRTQARNGASVNTAFGPYSSAVDTTQLAWSATPATFDWDMTHANWTGDSTIYSDGEAVHFYDTGNATSPINVAGVESPASVNVNNTTKNYVFSGPGYITGSASLTKSGNGTLTISTANNDYSGGVTLNAGTLVANDPSALGSGTATLNGGTLGSTSASAINLPNTINLAGAATINANANGLTLSGNITNNGILTFTGPGQLVTLTGNNTYTGTNIFNAGSVFSQLALTSSTALGADGNLTIIQGGTGNSYLDLAGPSLYIANQNLKLADTCSLINLAGDTETWAGNIEVAPGGGPTIQSSAVGSFLVIGTNENNTINGDTGAGTVNIRSRGTTTINSKITGTLAALGKSNQDVNGGLIVASTNNTFTTSGTPGIFVGWGFLTIARIANQGTNCSIGAGAVSGIQRIDIGYLTQGCQLVFQNGDGGVSDRIINLAGTGGTCAIEQDGEGYVKFTSAFQSTGGGSKTISLQGSNTSSNEVAGAIVDNSPVNQTTVAKAQGGTWILSGTNTYTGGTTVSAGTLVINGNSSKATGAVTVNSGATLGGNGTIGGALTVNSGATIAPGFYTTGTFSSTNSVLLNSGCTVNLNLDVDNNMNDQIAAGTTITYGGTLNVVNVSVTNTLAAGMTFKLFNAQNASSYLGTFDGGINLPDLSFNSNLQWDTSGLTNNGTIRVADIVPSTNAMLASLVVSNNAGSLVLNPGFTTNNFGLYNATNLYGSPVTVTMANGDLTATNTLILNGAALQVLTNGRASSALTLGVGSNNIVAVRVVSESGTVTNLYTVAVYQTGSSASTNAYLISLRVNPGSYTPVFATNQFTYAMTNNLPNSAVTVTVTNANLTATNSLYYGGVWQQGLASGATSGALGLSQGVPNVVGVQVVSQSGTVTNLYTVNVILQPSQTIPHLTNSMSGGSLVLKWPADHLGYRLQSQTNSLSVGLGANWVNVAGSPNTTQVTIPMDSTKGSVFYRLVYP